MAASQTFAAERIATMRTTATPAPTAIAQVRASGNGARTVPGPSGGNVSWLVPQASTRSHRVAIVARAPVT